MSLEIALFYSVGFAGSVVVIILFLKYLRKRIETYWS